MRKAIVDVEVNDEKFREFQALYEKYAQALSKMPGQWAKVGTEVKEHRTGFEAIAAALLAQNDMMAKRLRAERDENRIVRNTAHWWSNMARSSRTITSNVIDATKSLLKWSGIFGAVGGLLGGGGLWGIDRLAYGVGATRRTALGQDVTYGEQKAFDLNFGRVLESGFLSNVNNALHDVTKRFALYGGGLSEQDLAGKNTAEVASLLLPALKRLADQSPANQLAQVLQARGLDQLLSLQEFQRLRATPASELESYLKSYSRDRRELGIGTNAQLAWQNFSVQMSRAGQNIETVFVRDLTKVIPGLNQLSESVARAISAFLGSKNFQKWMDELGPGIEKFAKYIGGDDFQKDVKSFADGIGTLAEKIAAGLRFLGVIPQAPGSSPKPTVPSIVQSAKDNGPLGVLQAIKEKAIANDPTLDSTGKLIVKYFQWMGLSRDDSIAIAANAYRESGLKANAKGDYDKAGNPTSFGLFQWHGSRVEDFKKWSGGTDLANATVKQQLEFAYYELTQGKEKAALAALKNATTLAEKTAAFSNTYERPKNRAQEASVRASIATSMANPKPSRAPVTTIKIENNTGGNAIVSASQLPR